MRPAQRVPTREWPPTHTHTHRCPARAPPPAGGGPAWKIQHENQHKWANPLIGWTSTADPLDNVARQLYFPSKEAAVAFAGAAAACAACWAVFGLCKCGPRGEAGRRPETSQAPPARLLACTLLRRLPAGGGRRLRPSPAAWHR